MENSKFILILSLIVVLCLCACGQTNGTVTQQPTETASAAPETHLAPETPQEQPTGFQWTTQTSMNLTPTIPYEEYKTASQEEVARALLTKWLDAYLTEATDPRVQITDYHIDSIGISDTWKCRSKYSAKSIVDALISVQTPPDQPSHWYAGAGHTERNNWTIRPMTIAIQVNGDVYQMQILGNPPCSPGEND
jgi:hypothetical protein